ncbi:ABC transporter ATP-binding protein [uncultured Methanoregula sp.]|uniref:ABC transporter ATP-binding protein n=1 Tax=uncultured Methanoregula sp. TaxID=1005933 RepID=UPI002AAB6780|nr:ABC transporter ATP-binding protein [uncultured Methanoregula sp.]
MTRRRKAPDGEKLPEMGPTIRRFFTYLAPHRLKLAAVVLLMAGFALVESVFSILMGKATNIISAGSGPVGSLEQIVIWLLCAAAVMWICGVISQKFLADIAQEALLRLRTDLFGHIQTLSLDFFDRRPIGELMSRVTNDTQVIEQFLSIGALETGQAILTIVITSIIMLWINPAFTALSYLVVFAIVGVSWLITKTSGPAFSLLQEKTSDLNGFAEEWLSGAKTVIACRQQDEASRRFEAQSRKVAVIGEKAQFSALINQQVSTIFTTVITVMLLVVGGLMVMDGMAEIGTLITFISFSFALLNGFTTIFSVYAQILNAIVGASRVFTIMDEKPTVADAAGAIPMPAVAGDVVFDHVDFSYIEGRKVLSDNTFHAEPGQIFGLCGPTGAGKSTIINILTRYYDISSGTIRVDGTDVRSVQQDTLRVQIAQVLQEPFLFSDTIMANLKYAREGATDEECIRAAKQANAHDFILQQPNGYKTRLVDGGANLSQGQRQMLTIARAIVANPRMLILDEATSNVDTRTEKLIQEGLLTLQKDRTSFIIAHRLSTIRHADQILVIDKGQIVERGKHSELMARKGFYYELYMSQFRGKLEGLLKE